MNKISLENLISEFNRCGKDGIYKIQAGKETYFCPFPKYLPNLYCCNFGKRYDVISDSGNFKTFLCDYDKKVV